MRPRVLITGAARRVGRGVALTLAERGFDVAIHYNRSEEEAAAVVQQCQEAGAESFLVQGDLSTDSGCADVVAAVQARWSSLYALINNASTFSPCPFEEIDRAAWDMMMQVNLVAPMLLSQGLLPQLRAQGRGLLHAQMHSRGLWCTCAILAPSDPLLGIRRIRSQKRVY